MRVESRWGFLAAVVIAGCTETAKPYLVCLDGSIDGPDGTVDLRTDPTNCGCLGHVCRGPSGEAGGGAVCVEGRCVLRCPDGYSDCNRNPADGCETHTASDLVNCGGCGMSCGGSAANGASVCVAGRCGVMCFAGWGNCNGQVADGCETDLNGRVDNCGACGMVCRAEHAESICLAGRCRHGPCATGYDDCDGDAANGCEANLQGDRNHCGMCGMRCVRPNATAACMAGGCRIGSCNDGFDDCDRSDVNGCEVDLRTEVVNCGRCGMRCGFNNAGVSCVDRGCRMGDCLPNYANCDGSPTNGCEVYLLSNRANCGTCGRNCGTQACSNGNCV